jgi:hypothetical protein
VQEKEEGGGGGGREDESENGECKVKGKRMVKPEN